MRQIFFLPLLPLAQVCLTQSSSLHLDDDDDEWKGDKKERKDDESREERNSPMSATCQLPGIFVILKESSSTTMMSAPLQFWLVFG